MILNRLKAAGLVEKTAKQQHDLVLSRSSDKEVTGLANNDYMDLMRVAALIKRGAFDEAYEKLNSLDTSVRDEVPQEVYRFLDRKTGSGDHPFGVMGRNTYNENKVLKEMKFSDLKVGDYFKMVGSPDSADEPDPDYSSCKKVGPNTYKVMSALHSDVIGMVFRIDANQEVILENKQIPLSEF